MSNDDYVNLTRRKVLGGLAGIGAAGAATGAGTMALYSDSETSGGNTVQAGTLNLTTGSETIQTMSVSELAPGEAAAATTWTLKNVGTINGSLDVDVDITGEADGSSGTAATPTADASATEVAKALEVVTLKYDSDGDGTLTDIGQVTGTTDASMFDSVDSTGTTYTSLYNLANNENDSSETNDNDLINLADPAGGKDFKLELKLREEAGNKFQADGVAFDIKFILNQTDGQ
jgi:predicted ribosomally synthesized peptide with SipW-like signal peptide